MATKSMGMVQILIGFIMLLALGMAKEEEVKPCKELNTWIKDKSTVDDHGSAFDFITEMCDTLKVVKNAADKLKQQLNVINMSDLQVIKFLRYTKPNRPDDEFPLNIHFVRLRKFSIVKKTMAALMVGDFKESWQDHRFSWDHNLKLIDDNDKVSIHGFNTMWLPDNIIYGSKTAWKPSNPWASGGFNRLKSKISTMQGGVHPTLYRNGTITKGVSFTGYGNCSYDFTNYPYPHDEHRCCIKIRSAVYGEQFRYNIWNNKLNLEVAKVSEEWKFMDGSVTTYIDEDNIHVLNICAKFHRYSSSIYAATVIPLVAVIFMLILVPIFTGLKFQVFVKIFGSLLLFLNLNSFLSHIGDKIGFAGNVPMIFTVYDFVIWLTVANLIITLIFWSLTRREYLLPPPHGVLMMCDRINRLCWCSSSNIQSRDEHHHEVKLVNGNIHMNGKSDHENGITKPAIGINRSYRNEWESVYCACHSMITVLVSICYIIGIFFLVASCS